MSPDLGAGCAYDLWPLPISPSTYRDFLVWHQGRCAFCGKKKRDLVVDHDHDSGLVRGLLCIRCNHVETTALTSSWAFYRKSSPAKLLGLSILYKSAVTSHHLDGPLLPLSIRVTDDLRTRFRVACAEDHRKVQDVTAEILGYWLDERGRRKARESGQS